MVKATCLKTECPSRSCIGPSKSFPRYIGGRWTAERREGRNITPLSSNDANDTIAIVDEEKRGKMSLFLKTFSDDKVKKIFKIKEIPHRPIVLLDIAHF